MTNHLALHSALKIAGPVFLALALVAGGVTLGWNLHVEQPRPQPITTEMTLDARNRPATLKTFIMMPDGTRLAHGPRFKWAWPDRQVGCLVRGLQVEREDYDFGESRGFSAWNDPDVVLTPEKRIEPSVLARSPNER